MRYARARRRVPRAWLSQQYEDDHMGWKSYYGYRQTRFSADLQAHMEAWCDRAGRRTPNWNRWTDGLHPRLRDAAEQAVVADSVVLHDSATHLRSSQAFAFNLFLPFRDCGREPLDRERPRPDEPATAVDVVLWSTLVNGRRAAVLVEVKLAEAAFSMCRGKSHPDNDRQHVCTGPGRFFTDHDDCFVRRAPGRARNRRYWEIFASSHGGMGEAFPGADPLGACPFTGPAYHPMRNLAAAEGLVQDRLWAGERAWVALCAHDDNPGIAAQWAAWRDLLPEPAMAPLLPASEVIRAGEAAGLADWAAWMRERYRLEQAAVDGPD